MEDNDSITLKELLNIIDSVSCEDAWGNVKRAYDYSNELKNKLERISPCNLPDKNKKVN